MLVTWIALTLDITVSVNTVVRMRTRTRMLRWMRVRNLVLLHTLISPFITSNLPDNLLFRRRAVSPKPCCSSKVRQYATYLPRVFSPMQRTSTHIHWRLSGFPTIRSISFLSRRRRHAMPSVTCRNHRQKTSTKRGL